MSIIWRITLIAWRHRVRLMLADVTILVGVGLSLLIPKIVGVAIDKVDQQAHTLKGKWEARHRRSATEPSNE